MNIAMIHYRVGETDGVSLEMDKWKKVLERNKHKVFYIAGSSGRSSAFIIDELNYRATEIDDDCFNKAVNTDDDVIRQKILKQSTIIENKLLAFFKEYKIDLVMPNNMLSLGKSPHMAIGLTNAIKKAGVKVIAHHHDFYWERECYDNPKSAYIKSLLEDNFPPKDLEDMKHVVINKIAQENLLEKKNIDSVVVPNVFEFDSKPWLEDDYNKGFVDDIGISDNQIVFLQATRVTNRKAIELGIDLIALLNTHEYREKLVGKTLYNGKVFNKNTTLVLAMVGMHEGGDNYEKRIIEHAKKKNVDIIVRPDLVNHSRHVENGKNVYSLWDTYVFCDIITYPSIYEGWGNQFLEGIFAKKPQIVFEYPVFRSDIIDCGFKYISLGSIYELDENLLASVSEDVLKKAADETILFLTDKQIYFSSVEENFIIGQRDFSLDALERLIIPLVDEVSR